MLFLPALRCSLLGDPDSLRPPLELHTLFFLACAASFRLSLLLGRPLCLAAAGLYLLSSPSSLFVLSAPVAFRRVALKTSEWISRDSNHHRLSVSAGKTNAIPTEPSGRLPRPCAFFGFFCPLRCLSVFWCVVCCPFVWPLVVVVGLFLCGVSAPPVLLFDL